MSATETGSETTARVSNDNFASESFVNDPPPQDGLLPNGEPKRALEHRPHRGRRAVAPVDENKPVAVHGAGPALRG